MGEDKMNSADEKFANQIRVKMQRLREELAAFTKSTHDKLAALELTYETMTGDSVPKDDTIIVKDVKDVSKRTRKSNRTPSPRGQRPGRRGMKIDRQGVEKTLQFMIDRFMDNGKSTTPAMVARKFNITKEAASQRLYKALKLGWGVRSEQGNYIPSPSALGKTVNEVVGKPPAKAQNSNGIPHASPTPYGFPGRESSTEA